jgi:hypothetical protein
MTNSYGLDVSYFEGKLKLVLRDIKNYTPDELARELARYSVAADKAVILEPEFNKQQAARIAELKQYLEAAESHHRIIKIGNKEEIKKLKARIDELENTLSSVKDILGEAPELNYANYGAEEAESLNEAVVSAWGVLSNTTPPAGDEWQSVEEFQSVPNEGLCWIIYKGRVVEAYHDHNEVFRFHKHSTNCYMTECIPYAMPINAPQPPQGESK